MSFYVLLIFTVCFERFFVLSLLSFSLSQSFLSWKSSTNATTVLTFQLMHPLLLLSFLLLCSVVGQDSNGTFSKYTMIMIKFRWNNGLTALNVVQGQHRDYLFIWNAWLWIWLCLLFTVYFCRPMLHSASQSQRFEKHNFTTELVLEIMLQFNWL